MNQKLQSFLRKKANKLTAIILMFAMLVTIIPSNVLTAAAADNSGITVALNKPQVTDSTKTKYTFSKAAVAQCDSITSITFSVTNSTTIASAPTSPAPSSSLSSIDGTTRVYTYVFASGITSAQAQSFIQGIVFNYVANAEISVTVDANKTVLPAGAKITKLTDSAGKDHYYMYVPSNYISWTNAYNAAKGYTYMGMKGYLATVTSSEEDKVLTNISTISAWSAGTRLLDSGSAKFNDPNSVWLTSNHANYYYWACGPEAGTIFYNSIIPSTKNGPSNSGYNGAYNNWGTTQPDANNTGEVCVQVNWPYDKATTDMRWNDLPNEGIPSLGLVKGYFVEFSNYAGGMDSTYASDKTAVNLYDLGIGGVDTQGAAVTLTAPTNLTYDGTVKAYTAAVSGAALVDGTDYTLTYTGRNSTIYSSSAAPKNAGDYMVTFALTDSGKAKCTVTGTLSDNFTVTPATLTVTPTSEQSKLVGTVDPALTYTYSGNVAGETPAFTGLLSRDAGEAVGNYAISKGSLALADGTGGFLANNYTIAFSAIPVNFAVIVYTFTVKLNAPTNLTYDGTVKDYTAAVSGAALVAGTDYTFTYTGRNSTIYNSSTAPKNAGDYTVAFALTDSGKAKCTVTGTLTDNFTVKPATLTVTPKSEQSKLFGTVDPVLTYTYRGNINDETPVFSGALSRNTGDTVGNYEITKGNLSLTNGTGDFLASNYTLAFSTAPINFAVTAYTPAEHATLSSPNGNNGWFKDGVKDITLTAPEGFAISATGTLTTSDWASSITVDKADGSSKTANYYLKRISDGAISVVLVSDSYKADTAAPTNLAISYGTDNFKEFLSTSIFGLFFKDTVTVTLTATDAGSNIKEFEYILNGAQQTIAATNGIATFTIAPQYKGNISGVKAIDNAGNESVEKTIEYFAVDNQKPAAPTIDTNGYTSDTWTKDDVKITVSGASATSGIAKYQYSTDGGATWSDMTTTEKTDATATEPYNAVKAELTINNDSNGSVLLRAVSNTGIEGETSSVIVKFDATAPIIKVSGTGTTGKSTNGSVAFTLSNTANNISPVTYWFKIGSGDWKQLPGNTFTGTAKTDTTYQFKTVSASGLSSSISKAYLVKIAIKIVPVKIPSKTIKKVIKHVDNVSNPDTGDDNNNLPVDAAAAFLFVLFSASAGIVLCKKSNKASKTSR